MKTFNKVLLLIVALFTTILLNSCKKEQDNNVSTTVASLPAPDSKISGTVQSPSGSPIGSAKIIAGGYSTLSDMNGAFELDVYHGNYTLKIQTGSGTLFMTSLNVNVNTGQVLSLAAPQSTLQQVGTLAYIPGAFDKIESIIIDSLGYSATALTLNDLSNYSSFSNYGALFLNCGLLGANTMDSLKYTNLSTYLHNHGSIYASDFAVECITGDGNWRLAAPSINQDAKNMHSSSGFGALSTCVSPKLGGFLPDSSLCTSKSGPTGLVAQAVINDPAIINLLGKNHMDINYDLGGWEVINQVDAPFNSIITDSILNRPLAVKSYRFSMEYGGIIFYTTFHNKPQGLISPDMKNVLQYFILNL